MMGTRYIFPMKVQKWSTLQTEDGTKLKPGAAMNAVGFIPVYESIQAMVEDHGTDIDSCTFEAVEPRCPPHYCDNQGRCHYCGIVMEPDWH